MSENNLIVFYTDGSSRIFTNTRQFIMSAHDLLFSFRTDEGVWFLNKNCIKQILNLDIAHLAEYLDQNAMNEYLENLELETE